MPRIWGRQISDAYDMTEVPMNPAARPLKILARRKCHQFVEKHSVKMVW